MVKAGMEVYKVILQKHQFKFDYMCENYFEESHFKA